MKKIIFTLALLLSTSSFATGIIKSDFVERYPDFKGTNCKTCHTAAPQLNPYGIDLQKFKLDFKAVEPLDSDGDTFTNLDEIKDSTKPGDKDSAPVRK